MSQSFQTIKIIPMKIAIIGKGEMGSALGLLAARAGHAVVHGGRDRQQLVSVVLPPADMVIVAIPYDSAIEMATDPAVQQALAGKIVIDITNPLTSDYTDLSIGHTTSAGEEMARWLAGARVVKAFNTIFSAVLAAKVTDEDVSISVLCASDDTEAKAQVLTLVAAMGMVGVDVGRMQNARYLEPISVLILQLAFPLGRGERIGFQLVELGPGQ